MAGCKGRQPEGPSRSVSVGQLAIVMVEPGRSSQTLVAPESEPSNLFPHGGYVDSIVEVKRVLQGVSQTGWPSAVYFQMMSVDDKMGNVKTRPEGDFMTAELNHLFLVGVHEDFVNHTHTLPSLTFQYQVSVAVVDELFAWHAFQCNHPFDWRCGIFVVRARDLW